MPATSPPSSTGTLATHRQAAIWSALDELLLAADVAGILANKVGPVAARSLRQHGRAVPPELENSARLAKTAWMTAISLLARIRSMCDGPLLLIKGAEAAAAYPGRARSFMDVDLLTPDAAAVHASLRSGGFIEVHDPELYVQEQHHLRPLQWPELWPWVEIHLRPLWPQGLTPPPVQDIVASAVPSATGVPGLSAPHPAHHAVILASHAWATQPFQTLRDLVDVAAVAAQTDPGAPAQVARRWGIERIWRTTYEAADGLLGGQRETLAVRLWGRHLPAVQERSVMGNHAQRWLHNFWGLPLLPALRMTGVAFRQSILPYPDESWREKLTRVGYAFARPRSPVSTYTESRGRDAGWQRQRTPRGISKRD